MKVLACIFFLLLSQVCISQDIKIKLLDASVNKTDGLVCRLFIENKSDTKYLVTRDFILYNENLPLGNYIVVNLYDSHSNRINLPKVKITDRPITNNFFSIEANSTQELTLKLQDYIPEHEKILINDPKLLEGLKINLVFYQSGHAHIEDKEILNKLHNHYALYWGNIKTNKIKIRRPVK